MKLNCLYTALFAIAIVAPTSAQVGVYIRTAPPPLRYEERGQMPGPGYAWTDGYWAPNGHHYRWVQGRWDRPPFEGAYWSHPHYDHYQQGWQMHEGHWDHENHEGQERGRGQEHHDRDHEQGHDH